MLHANHQAMSGSHYRETKFADHFNGLNYGLIDFIVDEESNSSSPWFLSFKILNHLNRVVIEKNVSIPLPAVVLNNEGAAGMFNMGDGSNKPRKRKGKGVMANSVCKAFHGDQPIWRDYLLRGAMILIPFVIFVIPFLVFVWFLFTAALYWLYNMESTRREKLMKVYNAKTKKQL